MTIFAINFMDRQILAILGEPLKAELALSDTQIGLLYGFTFAATFSIAAVPIARFADHTKRTRIVVWSLVGFTVMTAACGLALNFWQLLLARVGVAVGEGGTNPPSHSLISDLYPIHRRSTAMAQREEGPVEEVRSGDSVRFAPREIHWLGASAKNAATFILLQDALDGATVEWVEHVSDNQYQFNSK